MSTVFIRLPNQLRNDALYSFIDLAIYRFLFNQFERIDEEELKALKKNTVNTRLKLSRWAVEHLALFRERFDLNKTDAILHLLMHIKKNPNIYHYDLKENKHV